jgi:predicted GIY-YIG superfamily endonuclease
VAGAFVYILRGSDGSYYVGTTRDTLERRVNEHNAGAFPRGYTKSRLPVELVFHQEFELITDAIAAERRLKGWSRAKKEALIAGDFEQLKELAVAYERRPHPSTGSG